MAITISETRIDLVGAEGHRFRRRERRHNAQRGGAGIVTLERHHVGPVWAQVDRRVHPTYTKLSAQAQHEWASQMENEMLEHWFSLEIARARD